MQNVGLSKIGAANSAAQCPAARHPAPSIQHCGFRQGGIRRSGSSKYNLFCSNFEKRIFSIHSMVCVILLRSRDRGSLYSLAQHALQTYREGLPRLRFHLTDLRAGLANLSWTSQTLQPYRAGGSQIYRRPHSPYKSTSGACKSIAEYGTIGWLKRSPVRRAVRPVSYVFVVSQREKRRRCEQYRKIVRFSSDT